MKKFFKIFGVLFILLFQFTSCLNDDNRLSKGAVLLDEPVVVVRMGEHPIVRNQSFYFYVPELEENTTLEKSNLLWTSFIYDFEDPEQPELDLGLKAYTAKPFKYKAVDSAKVIIPADFEEFQSYLSDDYTAPIESSALYLKVIDSLWFFGFIQKDQANKLSHTYELILNPEIEHSNDYPTFYIRSKQVNASDEHQALDKDKRKVFAFDVTDFVIYYRNNNFPTGPIRFNIKYKNGENSNGKDIYKDFLSNPISWNFAKKQPK